MDNYSTINQKCQAPLSNQEIAHILYQIGEFLEIQEVAFKPRAYERVARAIEALETPLKGIYEKGSLKALGEIPGVEESIAEKIEEFIKTGHLKYYEQLKKKLPKIIVRKFSQGVDFLGYVCFPHFRIPRLATEKRIFRKIREKARLVKSGGLSAKSFHQTMQSYFGILDHSNSFQLRQELKNQIFFWLSE